MLAEIVGNENGTNGGNNGSWGRNEKRFVGTTFPKFWLPLNEVKKPFLKAGRMDTGAAGLHGRGGAIGMVNGDPACRGVTGADTGVEIGKGIRGGDTGGVIGRGAMGVGNNGPLDDGTMLTATSLVAEMVGNTDDTDGGWGRDVSKFVGIKPAKF